MNKKPFDDPPLFYFFDKFSHRVALVSVSGNLSGRMPLRFVVLFNSETRLFLARVDVESSVDIRIININVATLLLPGSFWAIPQWRMVGSVRCSSQIFVCEEEQRPLSKLKVELMSNFVVKWFVERRLILGTNSSI